MSRPRVSVVMPVRNAARYLPAALVSILDQTLADWELVAVDDGSTDATPDILAGWGDPRLRVARNQTSLGVAGALNVGLGLAQGEYVARQDGDDLSRPERLAKQAAYLDAHPEAGLVAGLAHWIDQEGRSLGRRQEPQSPTLLAWRLLMVNPVSHGTVMFRRALVQDLGGYDPAFEGAEDYELWSRLARRAGLAQLPEELVDYRVYEDSYSNQKYRRHQDLGDLVRQRKLSLFLGREIPLALARWVHRGDGGRGECRAVLELWAEIHRTFLDRHRPSQGEAAEMRSDLAQAAWALARRSWRAEPGAALAALLRSLKRG
jgi:glycosyltransferase involved in cell wall biosynthesis